jgi:hypothetical protein
VRKSDSAVYDNLAWELKSLERLQEDQGLWDEGHGKRLARSSLASGMHALMQRMKHRGRLSKRGKRRSLLSG